MRLIPLPFLFIPLIVFFTSCSDKQKQTSLTEKFTAYISINKKVIFSGNVNIQAFLDNADYKHIPKLNNLITNELTTFNQGIYLDSGLFFSVEGLLDSKGNPSEVNVFAPLKNKDSIQEKIAELGLLLEHGQAFDYAIGPKYGIGIQGNTVVFHFDEIEELNKNHFKTLFKHLNTKTKVVKTPISAKNSALQLCTHLDHIYQLYTESNVTSLDNIKKKEIQLLLKDATLVTDLIFEQGGITISTSNQFSQQLKKRLQLHQKEIFPIAQLAKGRATAGISVNFDPLKIQTLLEDFMPDFFEQLRNIQGNIALGMMIAGERPISNVFGGKIAFVYFGNDASKSVYVSLGEQGKMIADLSRSFLSDNSMYTLNVHDKFLAGTSIGHVNNHLKLEIPTFATDFGENGIDGFVNMKELTTHEPDLLAEYPFLQSISWVKLSANIDGSTIRIQGKNKRYGILKQVADVYLELIKKQLKMFS